MREYKFKVIEYWFGGTKERILTVKARTIRSAQAKLRDIQGNRDWDWRLIQ